MPGTDTVDQFTEATRTAHPDLLESPHRDAEPVTIHLHDTCMGERLAVILHQAPDLLPAWLDYLGLAEADLTTQHVVDAIWTRSAHFTWHGIRASITSFEVRR